MTGTAKGEWLFEDLRNFPGMFLGQAKQALYLSYAKANTNGTKPATMMMTHAPVFGCTAGDGGVGVGRGLTRNGRISKKAQCGISTAGGRKAQCV